MKTRIAFVGDVVGRLGRQELEKHVQAYKEKYEIDFFIANCENASGGFGLSPKNALEIFSYGIDAITGGNHSFDKKDIASLMDDFPILRPYNFYSNNAGKGIINLKKGKKSLTLINLIGQMGLCLTNNAFLEVTKALEEAESENILIDFHAEMTSEKAAMFAYLKGKVSALLGSHTHVGSDDLHISQGSLFLTDIGLTGSREGVIGMNEVESLAGFLTGRKQNFKVNNKHKAIFQVVIFDLVQGKTVQAFKIKEFDGRIIKTEAYHD